MAIILLDLTPKTDSMKKVLSEFHRAAVDAIMGDGE